MNTEQKNAIINMVIECLAGEPEIIRIVLFGSFLTNESPNDLDVAIFQNSNEKYLPLAMKYRKKMASVARLIPVDVIPVRPDPPPSSFLSEIEKGRSIYER